MKKIFLFLFTLFCVVGASAQSDSAEMPIEEAHPKLEQHDEHMAEYPGGYEAMVKFIIKNTVYPKKAEKEKIQGTVKVSFVVEKDGSISNIKTIGKEFGSGLEEEAIRVISLMPNFAPGTIDGKPVKVRMVLPIKFKLEE